MRLNPADAVDIIRVARAYPATPFNLNYADADGRALALCLGELLAQAGWSQLSAAGPAPGFTRRGVILWAPPEGIVIAEALAVPLRALFVVEIVERHDGGPVAVTVGQASWATTRGLLPEV